MAIDSDNYFPFVSQHFHFGFRNKDNANDINEPDL